jgi:hypothetical protein
LLAAQGEHQEKKLRFFGNLVANIAFHPEIDRAHANHLIAVAENLSYRQLCALALFANKDRWGIRLRQELSDVNRSWSMAETSLYQEIFGLYSSHLIGPSNSGAILGLSEITPGRMEVWGVGIILYNLMELGSIESGEVADMVPLLQLP